MHREELVGIQTIWWVDYQLAVGFLTGSWKSNMDVWISNQLFGNPTACLSWPRCNGAPRSLLASPCSSDGMENKDVIVPGWYRSRVIALFLRQHFQT